MYKRKNLGSKFQERSNLNFLEDFLLVRVCLMKINNSHINADNSKVPGKLTLPGSLTML